jgi:cell fate (sporulation/competence/biofilm development) regulator YlbF (YheA/YmcA/DUF963 family)
MEISMEIRQAALSLGEALRSTALVQNYLAVKTSLQEDHETVTLELSLDDMAETIKARKRTGEHLNPEAMEAYYALRSRVWENPLVIKREATLGMLKPLFADVTDDINEALGVDFIQLSTAE